MSRVDFLKNIRLFPGFVEPPEASNVQGGLLKNIGPHRALNRALNRALQGLDFFKSPPWTLCLPPAVQTNPEERTKRVVLN